MKRIILTVVLVFATITAFSQTRMSVSFVDFQEWVKQIKIPGYPLDETLNDERDYSAMFASSPTKVFEIRMSHIGQFESYGIIGQDALAYTWNGHRAIYKYFKEIVDPSLDITIFVIEYVEARLTISFSMYGNVTRAKMEEIASKTNYKDIKIRGESLLGASTLPSGVKWPEVIPQSLRINGVESIISVGSDGLYKDVIEVYAVMGEVLITSLKALLKTHDGDLSLINTKTVIFICAQGESIEQIKREFKIDELVKFIYYIK